MVAEDRHSRLSQIETAWTLVVRAHGEARDAAAEAQRSLMERYLGAVYRYLLGAVRNEEIAGELFQEFAIRFLRGGFRRADPERGRFRNFVKTALINLINDHHKQEARRRRTQSTADLGPDFASTCDVESEQRFLESWREELLARVWDALARIEKETGKPFHTVLRFRIQHPNLRSPEMIRIPLSTVTLTSSFLTSGNSALMRYSFSSSVMSANGVQSARVISSRCPSGRRRGRPKSVERRFWKSSISRNGSKRVSVLIMIFPFEVLLF